MFSNYLFVALLLLLWPVAFLLPDKKVRKGQRRLLWLVRLAFMWWVVGMGFYFLGFLLPNFLMPKFLSTILNYTLALPCRLGIGLENLRVSTFGLSRFDLAWAMIWGLPFSFLGAAVVAAAQANLRRLAPLPPQSSRV
ncbi:MAG TPA: hypothetical protein VK905_03530 [Bacillota bacterium]|nr:hypothetical protein [Bacillota bacterium]